MNHEAVRPHALTQLLNPVDEAEIDVVSEDADTPTVSTLHGQFAEMNVVPEIQSPHHKPSIAFLLDQPVDASTGHTDSGDDAGGYENQLVSICCMLVDGAAAGFDTGLQDNWRSDEDEDLEGSDDADEEQDDEYLDDEEDIWGSEEDSPEAEDDDDSDYMEGSRKKTKKKQTQKGSTKTPKSGSTSRRSRGRTPGEIKRSREIEGLHMYLMQ